MSVRHPLSEIARRLATRSAKNVNGCLLFTGYRDKQGYARMWDGEENRLVHRLAHETFKGPIPDGYQVDHLCRVRHCINPDHLEAVTALVNTRRSLGNASKTHCIHGHPFNAENTRFHPRGDGCVHRMCRRCDADRQLVYKAQRRAAA